MLSSLAIAQGLPTDNMLITLGPIGEGHKHCQDLFVKGANRKNRIFPRPRRIIPFLAPGSLRMRMICLSLLLILLLGSALGGCGKRGPLYLPDEASAAAARFVPLA